MFSKIALSVSRGIVKIEKSAKRLSRLNIEEIITNNCTSKLSKDKSKRVGVVYLYTFPDGRRYIGQTWRINKRLQEHLYEGEHNSTPFAKAKKKYQNNSVEILAVTHTQRELNRLEKFWIKHYNATSRFDGFNVLRGARTDRYNRSGILSNGEKNPRKSVPVSKSLCRKRKKFMKELWDEKKMRGDGREFVFNG